MSEKTDVVGKMESLARKWHEGQYRKGPERIPYIEHPKAVVGQLREWGYSETANPAILAMAQNDVFAVKLADRLCNLRDFSKLYGVGSEKMHSYFREAERLFDNLGRMGDRRSVIFKTVSEVWQLTYPDVAMPRGYVVGYQSLRHPETIDMENHLDDYPPELAALLLKWREKANALYGQWVGRYYIKNAAAYFRYKERDYCLYPFGFGDGSNEFFEDLFLCYGMQEALLELGAIEVFYSGMMD